MTPQEQPGVLHSARLEELYLRALELTAGEREQWLLQLQLTHPQYAQDVMALLDASGIEAPEAGAGPPGDSEQVPVRVGMYEVGLPLGEGATGAVYEAFHSGTQRHCAVKLLRAGLDTPSQRARFQGEAAFLGRLNHPGITQVYDAGVATVEYSDGTRANRCYLAMEFVDGGISQRWVRDRRLSPEGVAMLVAEAAEAVHHAHEAGLIHRDLKPENIMLAASGKVKVVDFGVARLLEDSGYTNVRGTIVGSLGFMSPEQLAGIRERVDTRSDVYALGATLYTLLAGRRLEGLEAPPLRSLVPTADRRLEAIVSKAMAQRPERRYGSAADLMQDLRNWVSGDPVTARPARFDFLRRWRRTHPRLLRTAAIALGAIAMLGTAAALRPELRLELRARLLPASTRSVRVFHFETSTSPPETWAVGDRLDRLFAAELAAGGVFRPSVSARPGTAPLRAASTDLLSDEQLAAVRATGAAAVLAGEFDVTENAPAASLNVRVRLIDASDGHTVAALGAQGSLAEAEAVVARLSRQLTETAGGPELTIRRRLRSPAGARQLVDTGLDAWLQFDLIRAHILLERAANADCSSVEARLALARALQDLGYREWSIDEAIAAERLAVDAGQRKEATAVQEELRSNWHAVLRSRSGEPADAAAAMSLAAARMATGQYDAAAALIRPHAQKADTDARERRWKLLEATLIRERPGRPGQLPHAQQLMELARRSGNELFLAEALDKGAEAVSFAGMAERSMDLLEESRQLFRRAGHRDGMIREMALLGQRRQVVGSTGAAIQVLEEAMRLVDGTGFVHTERQAANNLGQAYGRGYDLDASRRLLTRALALSWSGPRRQDALMLLWRLGIAARDAGQFAEARSRFREAVGTPGESPESEARTLNSLAEMEVLAGNADAALAAASRAEELAVLSRAEDVRADSLAAKARARLLKGDPSVLEPNMAAAIATAEKRGMPGSLAIAEMQWGEALLGLGRAADALPHLRRSVSLFRKIDRPAFLAQAQALEVDALVARGALGEARGLLAEAEERARGSKYPYTRILVGLASARLAAADRRRGDAAVHYRAALEDAERFGFGPAAAKARAALAGR